MYTSICMVSMTHNAKVFDRDACTHLKYLGIVCHCVPLCALCVIVVPRHVVAQQ